MIYLGNLAIGLLKHDSNEWKVKLIIASSNIILRADLIKTWLETNCPESSIALFFRDAYNVLTQWDGTLISAILYSGTAQSYIRWYQNNILNRTEWASNYYCSIAEGDTYTVFYK